MNKNYLFNEEFISDYPIVTVGEKMLYAPGEMVVKYIGTEEDVVVPEGIKAIGDNAFSDCGTIVTVSLPESLVWVGHHAFSKCPNLKEITIKEGLENTHKRVFSDLPALEKVHLPNTLEDMLCMFANCPMLQTVNIPDKVKYIDYDTFYKCPSIKSLYLGDQFVPSASDFEKTLELTQFFVSEDNEKIKVLNNIVYSKDGRKLLLARKDVEGCFFVPEGVETIKSYAFAHCEKLTEIVFPSTLYEIEDCAFLGCSELVRVHIPANVKRIGNNAFNRNKILPDRYVKYTDRSLKPFETVNIDAEAGTSYMGSYVLDFLIPDDKTPLVLPEYPINLVQKDRVVRFLLGYCLNPSKYTEVYAKGYQKAAKRQRKKVVEEADKQGLTGVSLYYASLDTLEKEKKAKQGLSKKKAGTDKKSASAKDQQNYTNLSISMAEAKKTWKLKPVTFLEGYENSKYYHVDTISLKEYKGNKETVVIPPVVGKKPVSTIGAFAFANNKTVKHIVVPDSVVLIEDYAFEGCSALESITIEGETISIGSGAFRDCTSLNSFSCKSESVKLDIQPFYGCNQLMDDKGFIVLTLHNQKVLCGCKMPIQSKEVIIPDGVERIDGRVFSYGFRQGHKDTDIVKKLRRVIIPNSVTAIASRTFSAENLQEVVLPKGLEELSDALIFSDCISLKELHLPSTITKLNPYFITMHGTGVTLYSEEGGYVETFVNENKKYGYKFAVEGSQDPDHQILRDFIVEDGVLERYVGDSEKVEIPDGVKEIGKFVFKGNSNICELFIPASVVKINEYALSDCHSLKKITIPGTVKVISDNAFSFSGLNEVELSNGITEIGEGAFTFCQLKEVVIPGTVKQIGEKAFSYNWTTMKKVVIEPGVEKIGQEAFAGNRMLEEIIIPDTVKTIEDKAFSGSENLKKIEMPGYIEGIRDEIF